MSTYTEEVGNKLNDILEKTYDAEKGFKKGAENATRNDIKSFFERKASERYSFGHELKQEILNFGQEVDKGGSLAGTIHRSWMDVKSFFSSDDDEAMLEEAITGENAAIDEYKNVLGEISLPTTTAAILKRQMHTISADLETIKKLEEAV